MRAIGRKTGGTDGFTIPEVLVATTIFIGVIAAVFVSLQMSRVSYLSAESAVQAQEEARRVLDHMVAELREAGRVNGDAAIPSPGAQRLDFQIVRSYDATACGGICWGSDDPAWPTGWVHYVLDAADPQNGRWLRCVTANRLDPLPADFAGCRVLATRVSPALADSSFTYDPANRMVAITLQTRIVSPQLPTGGMTVSPTPLVTRIRLRNS